MKILLVEDDETITETLKSILRDRNYIVDCAAEGELGWEFVEAYDYDLILLDIVLPKLNGIEFCKRLRSVGNQTPVLLLTAQNSSDKKVVGLDAGADDYVVKPFEMSELLARIRVLIRRRNSLESPILQWDKLSLNSSNHEVTYDKKILTLTPKEYRLLELFLRSGDRVLTREIILDRLWDIEEAPSENTVTAHIKDLRRRLKQAGANGDLIETVYGVGYRLKPLATNIEPTNREKTKKVLRQRTKAALATVWQKFAEVHNERIATLEQANRAWQRHSLSGELLQQAKWAAHKLAGGLGIFGFPEGSRLALEMEELLKIHSQEDLATQFSELLTALKNSLQAKRSQPATANQHRPIILAVDNRPELVQQITAQMAAVQIKFKLVTEPESIVPAIAQTELSAVIWTFSLADCTTETINNFARIVNDKSALPVILFTDNSEQNDLQKIALLGRHILLQRGTLNMKAIKAIVKTVQQVRQKVAKVLLVDDDPQILDAVSGLVDSTKIDLTVLDNPSNFWQIISQLKPDLLILDVAMPHFTGIELCQLLRNDPDPRWRELPILFLTVHNDLNTLRQILSAGADDCIYKTLASSELVPKIFYCLDRRQLLPTLLV
ncbi:MAG: response regulator [Cyanobacteria bacterium J06555_3]